MIVRNKVTREILKFRRREARLRRCQKRVHRWAEATDSMRQSSRLVMITLTYAEVDAWEPNHIRDFMLKLRKLLKSRLIAYAWVAELQKRGAVHYHVLVLVKPGTNIPKPDEAGLWDQGMTRIETARTPFYVVKYTGKEHQKSGFFPKGLRMYAVWLSPECYPSLTRWFFRTSSLPAWLCEHLGEVSPGARWKRRDGGGWILGGREYESPFEVLSFG